MCEHNDTVLLRVPVPASLSHTGSFRWAVKPVDRCLAPAVVLLNALGIYTANSCCGHGKVGASIALHRENGGGS